MSIVFMSFLFRSFGPNRVRLAQQRGMTSSRTFGVPSLVTHGEGSMPILAALVRDLGTEPYFRSMIRGIRRGIERK